MARHAATLRKISRLDGAVQWRRVEALLVHLGADVEEGSGSTVTFVLGGRKLTVDRPHRRPECGRGLVKRIRNYLHQLGHL